MFDVRPELENTPFEGPWVSCVEKEEFTRSTSSWEPDVQALLDVSTSLLSVMD
jgi:hypothetical protein